MKGTSIFYKQLLHDDKKIKVKEHKLAKSSMKIETIKSIKREN